MEDDNSQQPKPNQPKVVSSVDTDVTVAAPARPGGDERDSHSVEASAPRAGEASPDEQQTVIGPPPVSAGDVSVPPGAAPEMQPPMPASFPPPLPASPNAAGPDALTYRDVRVPHAPQGWQVPPGGMPRQPVPTPRPRQGQPMPPPTHVPWQATSSWGATTLSIQANTAAGASYLLWWISGLLVYFNERHNRFVRFHAMQSILLTGVLTIYSVFAYLVSGLCYDLAAATNQHVFHTIGMFLAVISFLAVVGVWLAAMIIAWSGTYLHWPVIGAYAERYAAPPAQPPPF